MKSFNPHTHAGCDPYGTTTYRQLLVSIHTPTQGVTIAQTPRWAFSPVSIHTPTQGVTMRMTTSFILKTFQSTHPRRV